MKENVGYLLKRTREVREIELEDIAKKTKISVRFLKAIEEERWDILPGDVFIKGFIKTYAQYLGLNPDEVVERYSQERISIQKPEIKVLPKKSFKINYLWIFSGLFLLVILFSFSFILLKGSKKTIKKDESETLKKERIEVKPVEKVQIIKEDLPEIELLFTRHCWLKVEVDGKNVFEGFKEASDRLEYNFKESFVLKVGDAGALQLIKNGVPQPSLGDDGQPVLFKLP